MGYDLERMFVETLGLEEGTYGAEVLTQRARRVTARVKGICTTKNVHLSHVTGQASPLLVTPLVGAKSPIWG